MNPNEQAPTPILEAYTSLECPYAYLATYRLRQVWPEYAGRVHIVWRTLALEYVNGQPVSRPDTDTDRALLRQLEPDLPMLPWARPDWEWPATLWPAFEALACAQAQSAECAFALSWALRYAHFAESRCLARRAEVFALAEGVAASTPLDLARFRDDWDHGRYKHTLAAEAHHGWHVLKLDGSATFVLPDGQRRTNPATDTPAPAAEDFRVTYRAMLDACLRP